jgi:hypothetical protein
MKENVIARWRELRRQQRRQHGHEARETGRVMDELLKQMTPKQREYLREEYDHV